MRHILAAIVLSVPVMTGAVPARALDVATCSQAIPDREVGVLQADLVCTSGETIMLGRNSVLRLNGHTISAASAQNGHIGIACQRGRCRVEGPGSVHGFGGVGIVGLAPSRLDVSGITVHDNGVGITADQLTLKDVTLTGHAGWAASAKKLNATSVTASDNPGEGLAGRSLNLTDVTTNGNGGDGVSCNRVKARRLTALGNGGFGVSSVFPGHTRLIDSTLTGNADGDVGSQHVPKLTDTTCETSRHLSEIGTDLGSWGVCAAD